ncbi:hypothetical protein LEP1GSC162_1731 [Leptospira santarosai str. CBC1531]|nr:hypothetical protein LEP1GSC162_1731 [Leptospira santarosai str. CBC1531]
MVVIGAIIIVPIVLFISLGEIITQGLDFLISYPIVGSKFIKYTSFWAITITIPNLTNLLNQE